MNCLCRANLRAFHETSDRIHTELTFINYPLSVYSQKVVCFRRPLKYLKPHRQTV